MWRLALRYYMLKLCPVWYRIFCLKSFVKTFLKTKVQERWLLGGLEPWLVLQRTLVVCSTHTATQVSGALITFSGLCGLHTHVVCTYISRENTHIHKNKS